MRIAQIIDTICWSLLTITMWFGAFVFTKILITMLVIELLFKREALRRLWENTVESAL